MKTIGVIGGLSWFSTAVYYRTINQLVNERLGETHSAKMLLYSLDFRDFDVMQKQNNWDGIAEMLCEAALKLEKAGADCIIIASNTPHLVADRVRMILSVPLIHIAEETAKEVLLQNVNKIILLGTKFTMENDFFKDRLKEVGIETIIPANTDRDIIHKSIFNELTKGIFKEETRKMYLNIINDLRTDGAEGVIFGCTEISLLIKPEDCSVKVFDTTLIHSKAVVEYAIGKN